MLARDARRASPSLGVILGLVFIVVAVAFKFGAVPFHMWVPDVYHGAPTRRDAVPIGTVPKIASFALAFRLLAEGLGSVGATGRTCWRVLAVLSMVVGNLVAIAQTNLKRMLAYSAIAQRRLHPARLRRRHAEAATSARCTTRSPTCS